MDKIIEELNKLYNNFSPQQFIKNDPIQIPRLFKKKEDIEICGFLTSILAWGQRKQIINNAYKLIQIMDNSPYNFVIRCNNNERNKFLNFKHRTINGEDIFNLCMALKSIYIKHGGLENIFLTPYIKHKNLYYSLLNVFYVFSDLIISPRTMKHISNVQKNSAAKRLNLFLRWMVRHDEVDLGIWNKISSADLYIPLDTHIAFAARNLNLLNRKQNDWKAVEELTQRLKQFDQSDPIKYDFVLFEYALKQKNIMLN